MNPEIQQMLSQMSPEELAALIQIILEARPVIEYLLQLSDEELQQLLQQIAQSGGAGAQPETANAYGEAPPPYSEDQAQANLYG